MSSKKRKVTEKKKRVQRIDSYFKFKEEGTYTLGINENGGHEVRDAKGQKVMPVQENSQLYYNRKSKPKIISYSESPSQPFSDSSLTLRNYNYLYAIDTNTRKIQNRIISVSFLFFIKWSNSGDYTNFIFWPGFFMDFMDCTDKPECYAWHKFIQLIEKGSDYDGHNTFGIVVDSELGAIPAINKGEIPIYEQYYLPNKMELIYASADKTETAQNAVIKKCDQYATLRLNRFAEFHKSEESLNKFPPNYQNINKFISE